MDAVRILPVLGTVLWMVPLLWPVGPLGGGGMATSQALLYLFAVWAALTLGAFALWRFARPEDQGQSPQAPDTSDRPADDALLNDAPFEDGPLPDAARGPGDRAAADRQG